MTNYNFTEEEIDLAMNAAVSAIEQYILSQRPNEIGEKITHAIVPFVIERMKSGLERGEQLY